ncbi:MAG: tRNA (adenosine(37)-N6)-threonylcarbamoyltransferase complex ATPase subunit type 1 TsaE [Gammaproteobacteria bacterium]
MKPSEQPQWHLLETEQETGVFAADVARRLLSHIKQQLPQEAWVLGLKGGLGSGKTTWMRYMLRTLGHQGPVPSPSYTLAEYYQLQDLHCWHLDLYRLQQESEVAALGLDEMLSIGGVSQPVVLVVEWPEKGGTALPDIDLAIEFKHRSADARCYSLEAYSQRGRKLVSI